MKVSKKGLIPLIICIVVIAFYLISSYNSMVLYEENVSTKYADVQASLQARLDKINTLMPSVQGYMDHESDVFKTVTELRSNRGIKTDSNGNLMVDSDSDVASLEEVDAATSALVSDIIVTIENYPELKSDTIMSDFMTAMEGVSNRIKIDREEYNESVQLYNSYIRSFPRSLVAGVFGFEKMDKFQASYEAQGTPEVKFN